MSDKEQAREDFETHRHVAPIDQSPDYRAERERLAQARRQRSMEGSLGPMPAGYGDGDPRITLAVLALFVVAAALCGGIGISMTGSTQLAMLGWAVLLAAIGIMSVLLLSPIGVRLSGVSGPISLTARRFASLALLITFGGLRLFAGSLSSGPVLQFVAAAVATGILVLGLLRWLTPQRALVLAITSALGVIVLERILRSFLFPLVTTYS